MHCPVRSAATCLRVRTPVATLHQRGKDIGTRYQARGAGSAKGISVFLLGRDPSYLFPPDSSLCCSLLSALLRNPTRRTILADSVYRTQKRWGWGGEGLKLLRTWDYCSHGNPRVLLKEIGVAPERYDGMGFPGAPERYGTV